MPNDLTRFNHQIDFLKVEIMEEEQLFNYINRNSMMMENLEDKKPKIIRWWFMDFYTAISLFEEIIEREELTKRIICLQTNVVLITQGAFKESSKKCQLN